MMSVLTDSSRGIREVEDWQRIWRPLTYLPLPPPPPPLLPEIVRCLRQRASGTQNHWNQKLGYGLCICLMHLALKVVFYHCIGLKKKNKQRNVFYRQMCILKFPSNSALCDTEIDLLWRGIIDSSLCNSVCIQSKCSLFFLNQLGNAFYS